MKPLQENTFPEWAPESVIREHVSWRTREERERAGGHERLWDIADMLRRLLTYPDMRDVWHFLKQAGDYKGPGVLHLDIYAAIAVRAYMGPVGEERFTEGERARWIAQVTKHANALAKLLYGKGADDWLSRQLWSMRSSDTVRVAMWKAFHQIDLYPPEPTQLYPSALSALLRQFAEQLPHTVEKSSLKRPHGPEARRAYFARLMVKHCREYLDGPRWRIVTATTAAAFDQPSLTQRQIIRLAKGDTKSGIVELFCH